MRNSAGLGAHLLRHLRATRHATSPYGEKQQMLGDQRNAKSRDHANSFHKLGDRTDRRSNAISNCRLNGLHPHFGPGLHFRTLIIRKYHVPLPDLSHQHKQKCSERAPGLLNCDSASPKQATNPRLSSYQNTTAAKTEASKHSLTALHEVNKHHGVPAKAMIRSCQHLWPTGPALWSPITRRVMAGMVWVLPPPSNSLY